MFILKDGIWTDARLPIAQVATVIRVQPFSDAYFAVIDLVPELEPMLALAESVRVAGRGVVIEVSPDGLEALTDARRSRCAARGK